MLRTLLVKLVKRSPLVDSQMQLFRQRLLSRGGGYPPWKTMQAVRATANHVVTREPLRVLMATSVGSHFHAMQMETVLGVALGIRGASVQALLCDGVLPGCQMCEPRFFPNVSRFAKFGPSRDLCGHCFVPGRRVYEEAGIPVHAYSTLLTDEDRRWADQLASTIPIAEIETFTLDGMHLGEHAKSGSLRFFARATIDVEPLAASVLRRYFKAALLTARATEGLLQKEKFDVAVFHHGIYVPQGVIGEVLRRRGVRVVNWNPAYRKNCFIFSHDDTYHHTLMTESVDTWENMHWSEVEDQQISGYLRSRWQGGNDWIRFTESPCFGKERILSEIGCSSQKPIIGCLTNVMWDAQLHYPANAFPNMLEWLLHTIRHFQSRPDLQLVIRVHPAEIRGAVPTRQPVVKEIQRHFPTLPPNVFVVPPESNVSTYALAELCDSVIIYGTKTGVELSSAGIPVIVAGEAWVRNKGVTIDASSPKEYDEILTSLPLRKRLVGEVTTRAKKYAYHFFFRRMIPVNVFDAGAGIPLYSFNGPISKLMAGQDIGLDCICSGILTGKPFVYDHYSGNHPTGEVGAGGAL